MRPGWSGRTLGLTVEFVDLRQVGENAGQLFGVEHGPHLLEKHLVQDLQRAEVGHLGGEELWGDRRGEMGGGGFSGFRRASPVPSPTHDAYRI